LIIIIIITPTVELLYNQQLKKMLFDFYSAKSLSECFDEERNIIPEAYWAYRRSTRMEEDGEGFDAVIQMCMHAAKE
jgi:hypothetical protein